MLNRKTMAALSAVATLACAGASFGEAAPTEGPFSASHAATTDWGPLNFLIPQFDEMGGDRILTKVTIAWDAGVAGEARVESLDMVPRTITATLAADINLNGPSGFSENPMPSDERTFEATGWDGENDFGGTSGTSFPNIAANESGMTMFTNPIDLAPFVGTGDVTFVAQADAVSSATGPGNVIQQFQTDASAGIEVTYEYIEVPQICSDISDVEPNDICDPGNILESCSPHDFVECGKYINGKLEKRFVQGCEPDTFLVLFDKLNNIVDKDDNGSNKGNGWASGLFGVGAGNGIIDNGDNTRSIRIGVTGRADGLDTVFNGLFQNAAHGQLGKFTLYVTFLDANGNPLVNPILPQGGGISENPVTYTDEFITGAEAFYINYTLPQGTVTVDIWIDNQIICEEIRQDVDFFCIENLVPLCNYCIKQVGGLDMECLPTATTMGWFDKSCNLILSEQGNASTPGFTELCVVADANGRVIFAISGAYDHNFNGIHDEHETVIDDRAIVECGFEDWGHGVAGCYTLCIEVVGDHGQDSTTSNNNGGAGGEVALIQEALDRGDLNMDGVTNTADLGILIGNFGWQTP